MNCQPSSPSSAAAWPDTASPSNGLRRAARVWLVLLLTVVLPAIPAAAQQGPGRGAEGPRPVGTVTAALSDVPQTVTLPGRAVAYEVAAVRPRVGGLVEAITYEPGRPIAAGAPMFQLETAMLQASLATAAAAEQGAMQARDNAQATVTRYEALKNKGVSRAELETAEVALSQAEAQLVSAQAARQMAALERERAVITAPISGLTSVAAITIGSLVTANQSDPLATVTRIDPIYVDVAAASTRILESRQKVRDGVITPLDPPKIALTLENGSIYEAPGQIASTGATVSATTGTVDLRLMFPNPDRMILPGQFLRVALTVGTVRAVLVPQRATSRLADGTLAAFVVREGKARRVMLTESGVWNNAWAVTQGVEAGDQVIVDGLANLRDGAPVEAVPVTLDENGVVMASDGAPAWSSTVPASSAATTRTPSETTAPQTGWRGWLARARAALGFGPDAPGDSAGLAASAAGSTGTGRT